MITKRIAYEITVRDSHGCKCGCCHAIWHGRFLGQRDNATIAGAIRQMAASELLAADTLEATPEAPGSWVGGAPSNGEMASYMRDYAETLNALAIKVAQGEAEVAIKTFDLYDTIPE